MATKRHRPPPDGRGVDPLSERDDQEERQAILRAGRFDPGSDKARGKATRGHDEVATRKHLEGSEQGPF